MKKKNQAVKLSLQKKTILPLETQTTHKLRGGGASEVDPFTCLSAVKCSNSKGFYTCKC